MPNTNKCSTKNCTNEAGGYYRGDDDVCDECFAEYQEELLLTRHPDDN